MGMKVVATTTATCLHWSPQQPQQPPPSSSFQTTSLASALISSSSSSSSSSPNNRLRTTTRCCHSSPPPLLFRRQFHTRSDRSPLFGTSATRLLHRSSSSTHDQPHSDQQQQHRSLKRACTANFDAFSDEDFSRKIQELALRFQLSSSDEVEDDVVSGNRSYSNNSSDEEKRQQLWELENNRADWQREIIPASIERKANSVNLPVSLRIIQRKMQWEDGFREAGESAYCSVKKAFSSMVFIIQELQSFTLQMREAALCYHDLQGILIRVQKEMHASFVWLFQQIFSHTPTLMVYVMILLANFTVYSMAGSNAIAASPTTTSVVQTLAEEEGNGHQKFDSSSIIKTYSISSPSSSSGSGKTTAIGGNNGGGNFRPVASGNDGDGQFQESDNYYRTILPDGASQQLTSSSSGGVDQERSGEEDEEVVYLWNSVVKEAEKMKDEVVDGEARKRLVSPVTAKIEADDDYEDYFRTELVYQTSLVQDPNNALLLANYAQFLFLVAQDYDRAEEYFKKAVAVKPADAEAYNKYAGFLWRVRNDLWGAEETYLEAISVDPTNSLYAANYAHFLWNTGGDDTCFPVTSPQQQPEP